MAHIKMKRYGGGVAKIYLSNSTFYTTYDSSRCLCFVIPVKNAKSLTFSFTSLSNPHGYTNGFFAKLKNGDIQRLAGSSGPSKNATISIQLTIPKNTKELLFANVDSNNWIQPITNTITSDKLEVSANWGTGMYGNYSWRYSNFQIH